MFDSLNRKILPISIRGYFDRPQRRLTYKILKEKLTSDLLKNSSELVYNCVHCINLNADYTSFEHVFMSHKKISTIPHQI